MKFKLKRMVFSLLFVLGLVFSLSIEAGSHGDVQGREAGDVNPGDEEQMKMFLDHIVDHHDRISDDPMADANSRSRAITIFARELRRSEAYHHEDVYTIIINSNTMRVVNHAKYPGLLGYGLNPDVQNSDVAGALKALLDDPASCQKYGQDDEKVACAARTQSAIGDLTIVAGIHHAEGDDLFIPPNCSDFGFELDTSAEEVYGDPTEDNLEAYVKGVIGVTQKGMQDVTTAVVNENLELALTAFTDPAAGRELQAKLNERFSERTACYGTGDLKHGNIYVFIMSTDPAGTVLLNGENSDLNGLDLEADDANLPGDDKSIAGLFRNALTGGEREPRAGDSATVNYRWHDPLDPDDFLENWFERGSVPGSSPKTSYIEVANLFEGYTIAGQPLPPQLLIFGSGVYPDVANVPDMIDDTMDDTMAGDGDDGACAIAGAGHTSQGALLNLFLIASVLFSVVFLRKRT